jgi:hypothetical protein
VLFAVLKVPLAQAAHPRSRELVGSLVTYSPAPHVSCGVQLLAFCVLLKVPAPQSAQVRSVLALPAVARWPGSQFRQVLQEAALVPVLNEPFAQALHVRFLVADPAALTN